MGIEAKPTGGADAMKLAANMGKVLESSQKLLAEYFAQTSRDSRYQVLDPVMVTRTFQEAVARALASPETFVEQQLRFWNDYSRLYAQTVERMLGKPGGEPIAQAGPEDKRFKGDDTRMPERMHSFYLRNMYLRNRLREPGGITLAGVPIDLARIGVPAYFLSTREDHIAPWKSTYAGTRLLSGPVTFVLGGSGHVAGVVNPPSANKYCYWTRDALAETPEDWLSGAKQHDGSWWPHWGRWIAPHGSGRVPAREPGAGALPAIEDAPGRYVKARID
jgi:hypothetical protein